MNCMNCDIMITVDCVIIIDKYNYGSISATVIEV